METKKITLSLFAILSLVLLVSFASALVFEGTFVSAPTSIGHEDGTFPVVFELIYTGADASTVVSFTLAGSSGTSTLNLANVTLDKNVAKNVTANIEFTEGQAGVISGIIAADPVSTGSPVDISFSVAIEDAPELTIAKIDELTESQNGLVNITNTGNVKIKDIVLNASGDVSVVFSPSADFDLDAGESKVVSVSADFDSMKFGTKTVTIKAVGEDLASANVESGNIAFAIVEPFCKYGEKGGNLSIEDINLDNDDGADDTWSLLDEITVDVKIRNNGDDRIKDILVELALFDSSGKNVADELTFIDDDGEEIDLGNLDDGKKETVTFTFKVPADFDDGNYKLAFKAYSEDLKETEECTGEYDGSIFEEIEVEREDDYGKAIVFDDLPLALEAMCGDIVRLNMDVVNIGDDEEDQTRVSLYNTELGLSSFVEIRNDLDGGDSESISFEFLIPEDAEEGLYTLLLSADYEYDDDDDEYDTSSDDDTKITLKVIGCNVVVDNFVAISNVDLDSDAIAGEEMSVSAKITSAKSGSTMFAIGSTGHADWAELSAISPSRIVTLEKGESEDVVFKFNVNEDVYGKKTFVIEIRDGANVEMREVEVDFGEQKRSGITGFASFGLGEDSSALYWVLGIVNVILILLIIIVAVRLSRR